MVEFALDLSVLDESIARMVLPLSLWILLSGLDDLFVLSVWAISRFCHPRLPAPSAEELDRRSGRLIAVFVPLWKEAGVIGHMLAHNLTAIRYPNYRMFVGVYPNDSETNTAVREIQSRFPRVSPCPCPHDGPTSKADCLNWIFQHMVLYEQQHDCRFDIIVIHDAEDLIHAESFRLMSYYCESYAMVQTPVLPLATPIRDFTHGVYCDDFAEFHGKDLPARDFLGGFIPSSGVGTAYRRDALEVLAAAESGRVFHPECLTEDYENGFRLCRLGLSKVFVPIQFRDRLPVATREYFPRGFLAALKQRTRWITGISFQSWQRHGWGSSWPDVYWFWRDRKGLLGNPLSILANAIFFYGLLTWLHAAAAGAAWRFGGAIAARLPLWLPALTAVLALQQLVVRACFSARVYGWRFALLTPCRTWFGNVLNSAATAAAAARYVRSRLRGVPLVWLKTEHAYPSLASLRPHRRLLGEILVAAGFLTQERLEAALVTKPASLRLGEHLVSLGWLSEDDVNTALSLQFGIPAMFVHPREVGREMARSLPARLIRTLQVLPIGVKSGTLQLVTTQLPSEETLAELNAFTRLLPRFLLVTPTNFRNLCAALL